MVTKYNHIDIETSKRSGWTNEVELISQLLWKSDRSSFNCPGQCQVNLFPHSALGHGKSKRKRQKQDWFCTESPQWSAGCLSETNWNHCWSDVQIPTDLQFSIIYVGIAQNRAVYSTELLQLPCLIACWKVSGNFTLALGY